MLELLGMLIYGGSIYAIFSKRVPTGIFCDHLLYGAAVCSGVYLVSYNDLALLLSLLSLLSALLWQGGQEAIKLLK